MLAKNKISISLLAWLVAAVTLVAASFWYPKWTFHGNEAVLSWDVFGYYLYLPAQFIYNDLGGVAFLDGLMEQYQPATSNYHAIPLENGSHVMKYSMGQAVFYLPFFYIGHLWAKWSAYPADGLSYPYQTAIFWGAMAYALVGLWFMRKLLLRYFSDAAVAIALLLLVFATNYLNYVSFDGAMTHNHLFTLYAVLLYMVALWHDKPSLAKGISIGFLCGLAALTRPTEIICLLIPVLWGVHNKHTLQQKLRLMWLHKWHFVAAGATMVAVGSLQLIYWKAYTGHWLYYSYEEQGFSFLRPHILNGLFSFKKGWFIYTPVMLCAVLGLIPLYQKHRHLFWAVAVFSALNVYITFSWDIWWYGGSFGARAMVQSYAVWLIPFAAFWQWALHRTWRWAAMIPIVAIFTWLNLLQTYHCHTPNGMMLSEGMTKKYWIEVFLKQKRGKHLRRFLDTQHEAPPLSRFQSIVPLLTMAPENTTDTIDGKPVFTAGKYGPEQILQATPLPTHTPDDWIRVRAKVYYNNIEWNEWHLARLGAKLFKDGKEIAYECTRLQWQFDPKDWYNATVEIPLNKSRYEADSIEVLLENKGETIYADTIVLEFLKAR